MNTGTVQSTKKGSRNKAILIGVVFCLAYLISYYFRKILGLVRTDIISGGFYTGIQLDGFQSLYMAFYAAGQLLNGIIGDFLPPRRMITVGFLLSGASIIVFPTANNYWVSLICFAVFGYGLSMLRGPIMKLITENTAPEQARLICVFFSFSTHLATFVATVFIFLFDWKEAFVVSGIISLAVAVFIWFFVFGMEKKGQFCAIVSPSGKNKLTVKEILKIFTLPGFVFFLFIGGLVETASTTITYWLPSFITGKLEQTPEFSNVVTSVISVATAFCSFVALALFKFSKGRTKNVMTVLFILSSIMFLTVFFSKSLWVSLICLLSAMLFIGCVSSLMWSIYIPSLGKSGKVSGANGILDCFGYLFASLMNVLFSKLAGDPDHPTWNYLIIAWVGLAVVGLVLTLFKKDDSEYET